MAGPFELRFYDDPNTGQPHIHNHGVEEWEVEDILELRALDFPGKGGTRVAIGQTSGGRY